MFALSLPTGRCLPASSIQPWLALAPIGPAQGPATRYRPSGRGHCEVTAVRKGPAKRPPQTTRKPKNLNVLVPLVLQMASWAAALLVAAGVCMTVRTRTRQRAAGSKVSKALVELQR